MTKKAASKKRICMGFGCTTEIEEGYFCKKCEKKRGSVRGKVYRNNGNGGGGKSIGSI
jgi:hypothetical protein